MLKRLTVAVAALFVLATSAYAAGTIPGFSLAQQQDSDGTPLVGCKLYTIQAGTTSTPQIAYQDSSLTLPLSYPVLCDAFGRLPQIFLADGSIKLRLTKENGTQVFVLDGVLVVGASSGGGGGSPVDATTILATGDLKVKYGTGVLSGFVRANGRTIGSATSGATERANSDCQSLFEYLWDADANLLVSTGRGASAAADWAANKTIALPDGRGLALAGLDDMGSSSRGVFSGVTFFSGNATTLGSGLGASRRSLLAANVPAYTPSGTVTITNQGGSTHVRSAVQGGASGVFEVTQPAGAVNNQGADTTVNTGITASFTGTGNGGSSAAFDTNSPYMLITYYLKL